MPSTITAERTHVLSEIARQVCQIASTRLRVVIDGYTASGKTTFANELAAEVRSLGRPTLRASLDDFKLPWRDARQKGYDRTTGEGYYRNAPDFASARTLLLEPMGPEAGGIVALCGHDPLTGIDHRKVTVRAPADAVLIVDGVFGMRDEYDDFWDLRIWLDVAPELSLARGIERDAAAEGRDEAERLHRDRYHRAAQIYLSEATPKAKAEVIVDNTDFDCPVLLRSEADEELS